MSNPVPDTAPRIVVENPDGSVLLGADYERIPKEAPRPPVASAEDDGQANSELASARRAQLALFHAQVLVPRRRFFVCVLGGDTFFFLVALITLVAYKRSPERASSHSIRFSWWLNFDDLSLVDIIMCFLIDVIGLVGTLQERRYLVSLFILLTAVSTALLTLVCISLFHVYRFLLLVTAFNYRSALITQQLLLLQLHTTDTSARQLPPHIQRLLDLLGPLRAATSSARGVGSVGDRQGLTPANVSAPGTGPPSGPEQANHQGASTSGAAGPLAVHQRDLLTEPSRVSLSDGSHIIILPLTITSTTSGNFLPTTVRLDTTSSTPSTSGVARLWTSENEDGRNVTQGGPRQQEHSATPTARSEGAVELIPVNSSTQQATS